MQVRSLFAASIFAAFSFAGLAAHAQMEGPAAVQVVVRADAKGAAAPLQPTDLKVKFDDKAVQVESLRPLLGGGASNRVAVALIIDDSLRGNFGTQIHEIEQFIQSIVSPQVALGVGYMQNGTVNFPAGFSTEAEQEMKAVRLPISAPGITASPYFCLEDLLKKWPQRQGEAHVVLMITNGIDPYNGSVRPENQDSPYVRTAIETAQKVNTPVYSIYYGRHEISGNLASFSGQSYLSQVAQATGGESYNQGQINPVSISPYFHDFQKDLQESYVLTFQTAGRKLERLKIASVNKGVKIRAQEVVGVPGAKL